MREWGGINERDMRGIERELRERKRGGGFEGGFLWERREGEGEWRMERE